MSELPEVAERALAWEAWCDSSGNPEHDRLDAESERQDFNAGWRSAIDSAHAASIRTEASAAALELAAIGMRGHAERVLGQLDDAGSNQRSRAYVQAALWLESEAEKLRRS